ncbi:DUF1049 domain-containing protein [Pseudanabaena sp. UWO310]|uniref:DUF1049 domain-containing protein n=1 Tax=Pseudanabaena sp. UWO310 TaxID=2480795 RepID=UPI00115A94DA|nr:DUF1049 domain-containing protein [Pseudanabaena sp. UWO310]TYQ31384.1 DUF1049 domain-containing protein [Pseudanabaena sp. UWO310]
MLRLSLYLFLWGLTLAIAVFAGQNTYLVNLKLFSLQSIKLPLGVVLVFATGLGAAFVSLWQSSLNFRLPEVPKFSGFTSPKYPSNNQSQKSEVKQEVKQEVKREVKKDISRTAKKQRDDFDDDWDDDWG